MSDDGSTDERSALAWIMSGTVGALVVGGFAKRLIDKRRDRALAEAAELEETQPGDTAQDETQDLDEAEGHPS